MEPFLFISYYWIRGVAISFQLFKFEIPVIGMISSFSKSKLSFKMQFNFSSKCSNNSYTVF